MERLGVPPTVLLVLKALHEEVEIDHFFMHGDDLQRVKDCGKGQLFPHPTERYYKHTHTHTHTLPGRSGRGAIRTGMVSTTAC
jgi:hypothetical protein